MTTRLLFIHALSALHAGTGQGVGVIDLPIARETATGLPYLPGSSIKGTLRDSGEISEDERQVIFGPPTDYAEDNAGSAQFADARLLLLPVRSLAGTFAWVTSPYVLRRFLRDVCATDLSAIQVIDGWNPPKESDTNNPGSEPERCKVAAGSKLKLTGETVVLEDLDLAADESREVTTLAESLGSWLFPDSADSYWRSALQERLCVVRDDVLNFLLNTATEVIARIQLQADTKTVKDGALWYEEALPAESILYGLIVASPVVKPKVRPYDKVARTYGKPDAPKGYDLEQSEQFIFGGIAKCTKPALQFGGKATVGRGVCRAVLAKEK